ncbi:MAG: hypothetical protein AAFQ01_04340 [Bacteroidota bacterium]
MVGFRWTTLLQWVLVAFAMVINPFIPLIFGAIAYESWRVVLNGLFQREVIASTYGLGSGTMALMLGLGVFLPWGLPLGHVLTTWLPRSRVQRLPLPFRYRITWILLVELFWTLAVVWFFSESVYELKQRHHMIE